MQKLKDDLKRLYSDASKHSVYQSIPAFVSQELGYEEEIDEAWRGDQPRINYLLQSRKPKPNEHWIDFGANTGFFTLSLAKAFPGSLFTAVEANPNHASFIEQVARHFELRNVDVITRSIEISDLDTLPHCDYLLHLNVLHHAGHDFDTDVVQIKDAFTEYAKRYLLALRERADGMLFQIGSNWGGNKAEPIVDARNEISKVLTFSEWLRAGNWRIHEISCATHAPDGTVHYRNLPTSLTSALNYKQAPDEPSMREALSGFDFNRFPGEFYRRPLFNCCAE